MADSIKKRGQKFIKKFSRASIKASENSQKHIRRNLIERIAHVENIRLLILEWALTIGALTLLATTQAFWYSDSYAGDYFTYGGTYTEATIGEVKSLNPLFATTSSEKVLSKLLFATITCNDYSGHPGMGLAKSVRTSDDGKIWTVKLKENLTWSDGEPLTNDDVLFTVQLIKNSTVDSIYDSNLANVNVSTNEANEIVFKLPAPYADFMSALDIPVVPKHKLESSDAKILAEDDFSRTPVTSGPFIYNAMQVSDNGERVYYLTANDNYYKGKPLLNSFAVHTYNDKDGIIRAINNRSVTATAELSSTDAPSIVTDQFIEKNSSINSGTFAFFNMSHEATRRPDLRSAIQQGVDWSKVRSYAPGALSLDYPILSEQIDIKEFPALPTYDVETAKIKIANISGDDKIHLSIATVNTGYLPSVTEAFKEELENLGIEADVSIYEENQDFITDVISRRNYDILIYDIELGAEPDLLPYYHSSQASAGGLNLSNYRDALVDDLLLGARDTLDEELRIKKYESFLERWVADAPAIGLYRPNLTYFYNKNVRTFSDSEKLVTPLDRFADLNNWAVVKTGKNKTP